MKVVRPIAVSDAALISSSVAETDYPAWSAGTTYGLATRVIVAAAHRVYESAIIGNVGHDPLSSPGQWLDVGPTNRWRMFDPAAGAATTASATIAVTLAIDDAADAIGLIDIEAGSVHVLITAGGDTVRDETRSSAATSETFLDLRGALDRILTITVTPDATGTASIGKMIVGTALDLGDTEDGPTIAITDFSRRVTDDFGVTTIAERAWARRITTRCRIDSSVVDEVQRGLADLRAVPALWIGDEAFASLTSYGFYKDFSIDLQLGLVSYCSLTFESLPTAEVPVPLIDPAPAPPSNFRVVRPLPVAGAILAESNVAETDYPAWASATVYAAGAQVILTATHRIYESLVDGNIARDPATDASAWLDIGPTNRWAMFDQALGTATDSLDRIVVRLVPTSTIDALAVIDVAAESVRVEASGFDRTAMLSGGATGATFLDATVAAGAGVTITIAGASEASLVSVGTLLIGTQELLGITEISPTIGIVDFSRKDVDDFGNTMPIQRAWSKRMAVRAQVSTSAADNLLRRIASLRATPCLWIGDYAFDSLTIYGFFRDFTVTLGERVSTCAVTIEGLSKAAPIVDPSAEIRRLEAQIAAISSDGILSPKDKRQAAIDHAALLDQRNALQTRYVALGSPSDIKTTRDAAFAGVAALDAYLASLAPAWDNPATSTPIVPADYRAAWTNAYQAVSAFAAAITGLSGAGSWTHIANSPTTIVTPTSGRGTSGATWGTDASQSLEAFDRGCSVSFTLPVSHNDDIMAGLASHPGSSLSFERISFAVFRQSDGYIDLRIEGASYSVVAGNYLFPIAGRIEFDGVNTVRWYIDATLRATYYWPYPDTPLYFATALAGQDPRVENISFRSIGARGLNGLDGSDGVDGLNGQSIHIAYADSADGSVNFTTAAAGGRTYIGVYTDNNPGADSSDYHAYGWTRLRGADGSNGLAGPGGYVHTAYANSADGSIDFHISDSTARSYLGAYTDQTLADSTDYHAYAWSLIKGADGVSASTIDLSAASINFAAAYDGTIKSGQQPQYVQASFKVGTTDVTTSAAWTITASSNCSASVNASGQVSITSVTGDGYVEVRGSYAGVTPASKRASFTRTRDAAPPAGATSLSSSVSGTQFASAGSFPSGVSTDVLTVTANASGQLQSVLALTYYADAASGGATTTHFFTMAGVARYRLAGSGGAWNDFSGGAVTGTSSSSSGSSVDPESQGTLSINQTQAGLSASVQYEVGVALRRSGSLRSTSADYSGTITVKQP